MCQITLLLLLEYSCCANIAFRICGFDNCTNFIMNSSKSNYYLPYVSLDLSSTILRNYLFIYSVIACYDVCTLN